MATSAHRRRRPSVTPIDGTPTRASSASSSCCARPRSCSPRPATTRPASPTSAPRPASPRACSTGTSRPRSRCSPSWCARCASELRRAQAAAMDPRRRCARPASARAARPACGSWPSTAPYFALLDVERRDAALAEVLREGSDVYAADVVRLVRRGAGRRAGRRRRPALHAVGVMGAVSSFSHALRNGAVDVESTSSPRPSATGWSAASPPAAPRVELTDARRRP